MKKILLMVLVGSVMNTWASEETPKKTTNAEESAKIDLDFFTHWDELSQLQYNSGYSTRMAQRVLAKKIEKDKEIAAQTADQPKPFVFEPIVGTLSDMRRFSYEAFTGPVSIGPEYTQSPTALERAEQAYARATTDEEKEAIKDKVSKNPAICDELHARAVIQLMNQLQPEKKKQSE